MQISPALNNSPLSQVDLLSCKGDTMLVLSRKIGESILVGENIKIVVLEVDKRQVRLGIESPHDILVLREEIAQRLSNENIQVANSK